jgi:valine--pyruvate aminotransferase
MALKSVANCRPIPQSFGSMDDALSKFGSKLCAHSGILELMDDLGFAMTTKPEMRMMGGGNPAAIPEMQALWRERLRELLEENPERLDRMLVNYDPPAGSPEFLAALADCLNRTYDWTLTEKNLAITAGGQTAFFFLFNMLAGTGADGKHRKILLPLVPEYIGYANQGITEDTFHACRPRLEELPNHEFKYRVDFDAVADALKQEEIAAICVSRPTNPSGNVLTDGEISKLSMLAADHGVPLIIDNAYGAPFPNVLFVDANPIWAEHIILTMSLSKLGLPGTRTGIVVANETTIRRLAALTAVTGLANNNVGQTIALPFLRNGELLRLSREVVQPFYKRKSDTARDIITEVMGNSVPWRVHVSEGAFFLWLWLPGLPCPTRTFYERLKERNVLIVPGEYFFYGLGEEDETWAHRRECIRITFSQPEEIVREGLGTIADVAREITG